MTGEQADIFGGGDEPPEPPPKTRYDEMREKFEKYHADNPHVWRAFRQYAYQLINAGCDHGGTQNIIERMRWDSRTNSGAHKLNEFKINNNYGGEYGRLFEALHSDFEGFFRTRHQTSKDHDATNLPELRPGDFD